MKIKKIDEKPMVLHKKKNPRLHIRKKDSSQGTPDKSNRMSAFQRMKQRMKQSQESIQMHKHQIHAMAQAGGKLAANRVEGGEELRESVEVMATLASPAYGIASKGAKLYRKKRTKDKERKANRRKERKTAELEEYRKAELKRRKTSIKMHEKQEKGKNGKKDKGEKTSGHQKNTSNGTAKVRMMEVFMEQMRLDGENQKNLLQSLKDMAKAEATLWVQRILLLVAPYILGFFSIVAICGLVVVSVIAVIYNSPLSIFFPMPETGYENPRVVLSEYYKEFNQMVIAKEETGNTLTYKNTENGVAISNYNDTLMVYMILYGNGQAGYVMDDAGKANLKKVFDEMNYISDESTTTTMQVGDSLGDVVATGYCACTICCGQWAGGNTAFGTVPKANHTLAVDAYNPIVPMGTKVLIGNTVYTVEDTGNLNAHGTDFDIFYQSHDAALQWGKRTVEAFIAEGDTNEVEVTLNGTTVFNLTYEDYIALGTLSEEQEQLLREMMDSDIWEAYYSAGAGQAVAELAMTKIGCHYSQDRRMEEGYYDCSSLVYRLYKEVGIELPFVASTQGKYCYENAMLVNKEELRPGDLIFYSYKVNNEFRNISHVAIYVGDGKMVHAANTSRGVVMDDLKTGSVVFYARPYN